MAITEGTQPVAKTWTGNWNTAQTTASFVPESGALLVALLSADGDASNPTTGAITDSLGGSWTLLKRQNAQVVGVVGGTCEVWCRDSPGASLTVSATGTSGLFPGGQLTVRTLIGALPTAQQNGATGGATLQAAAVQISVAAGTGNKVYGAAFNFDNSTVMAVTGNTTAITAFSDTTNGDTWECFKSTGDTAGTATYGYSTSHNGMIAAAEIKAAPSGFQAAVPSRFSPGRGPFRLGLLNRQQPPQPYPAAPTAAAQVPPPPPQTGRRDWLPLRPRGTVSRPVPAPPVTPPVTVWIPQPQTGQRAWLPQRRSTRPQPVTVVTIWIPPTQPRRRTWLPRPTGSTAIPIPLPPAIPPSPPPPIPNISRGRTFWTPRPQDHRADPPWPIAVIAASPAPPVTVSPTRKRAWLPRRRATVSQPVVIQIRLPAQPQPRRRAFLPRRRGQATQPVPPVVIYIQPPLPPQLSRRVSRWRLPFRRHRPAATVVPPRVGPPPVFDVNGRVVVTQTVTSGVDVASAPGSQAGVDQTSASFVSGSSAAGGTTSVDPTSDGRAEVG